MTIATAPRDLEALIKIGRFNARVLAQEGGLFPTEEQKTAFMQLSSEKQADALIKMLQRVDGKKPAAGGKATGGALPSGRSPSNGGKAAAGRKPATEQPPNDPAAGAAAARQPATTAAAPGEGTAKMLSAIQGLQASYASIVEALDNLGQQSMMQQSSINTGNRMTLLSLAVQLQIAEEVLHAPQSQILEMAFEDVPRLSGEVAKYIPDETSEVVENEAEDEGDGGNES